MADGNLELASHPIIYLLRHMPRGRKQAATSSIMETQVVRLPSWTAAQAPVVAETTSVDGESTHYRAVRGADGRAVLVAAIASQAFRRMQRRPGFQPADDLGEAHIFRFGRTHLDSPGKATIGVAHAGIGTHLSSNRADAMAHAAAIQAKMVLVDGVLHAPCNEPGWFFGFQEPYRHYADRQTIHQDVVAMPREDMVQEYLPFSRDPEWVRRRLRGVDPATTDIIVRGAIVEHVPHVFECDTDWHKMRLMAEEVYTIAHASSVRLMRDELYSCDMLCRATEFWPKSCDIELARRAVLLARIVHAVNATSMADILERMALTLDTLANRGVTVDLDTRLELGGVILPNPGDQARAVPARAGAG